MYYDATQHYVPKSAQERAIIRLQNRVESGENICDVLGIAKTETYYADKISKGLIPMSIVLFDRIMSKRVIKSKI